MAGADFENRNDGSSPLRRPDKVSVYAIVRIDDFRQVKEPEGLKDAISVVEVLADEEEAAAEADRLNVLNESKGARYFSFATRYYPLGRRK